MMPKPAPRPVKLVTHARALLMVVIAGAPLCAIGSVPACAQGTADAPITSGLFAGGNKPVASRQHFDFLVDSSETFDTHLPEQLGPTLTPDNPQSGGYSTLLKASSNYARHWSRTDIQASGSGAFRYYASLDEARVVSSAAVVGLTSRLSRNTSLQLDQNVAYSPSYLYQVLPAASPEEPGALPTTAPDYNIGESRSMSYGTTVSFSHNAIAGGRIRASGGINRSDFSQTSLARPNVRVYLLDGTFFRPISRRTELSLGYSHRNGEFGYGGTTTEQGVPVGFTYRGPLWITRHAELQFNLMPEVVDIPPSALNVARTGREYRVAADASLMYPFLRSWGVRARVTRRLDYIASLPQPVFSSGSTLSLEGYVARQTHVSLSASYANNRSVQDERAFSFASYSGDASVRYALSRNVGVYGGYLYYHYRANAGAEFLEGIPVRFGRTGLRAGLMVFVPVMGR